MDEMVHCFSLHICLRLSAVQKNDKLHQTEPVIGSRVVFLIFHFKKVAAKVFSVNLNSVFAGVSGHKCTYASVHVFVYVWLFPQLVTSP